MVDTAFPHTPEPPMDGELTAREAARHMAAQRKARRKDRSGAPRQTKASRLAAASQRMAFASVLASGASASADAGGGADEEAEEEDERVVAARRKRQLVDNDFSEAAAMVATETGNASRQLELALDQRRDAGDKTSLQQLDMSQGLPLPRSLVDCTAAADTAQARSSSAMRAELRASVRARVHTDSSVREVVTRHRELINEPGLRGRRLQEQRLAVARALYAPPPARFWLVLGLWAVLGLPLGAHRLALRRYRSALLQLSCAGVGGLLIALAATLLSPQVVAGPWTYEYEEAFVMGGIGIAFTTLGGLMWLCDGVLLRRGLLYKNGGERYDYTPCETREWWRAAVVWLLGGCLGAHRLWLRHDTHGCLHLVLTGIGIACAVMGEHGEIDSAFVFVVFCGALLLACGVLLWLRDLIQLLRGRLGPAPAPTAAFWRLFFACLLLGPFGAHRLLLRRVRSAWCFPLATAISGLLLSDLGGGVLSGGAPPAARLAATVIEAVGFVAVGGALLVGWARDMRGVLRGTLVPAPEGTIYWQLLYSWVLFGLPAGSHRMVAGHVTWKLFVILNCYGGLLLALSEGGLRGSVETDEGEQSLFDLLTVVVIDVLAAGLLLTPIVMWLRDMPYVLRGTLTRRPEDPVFYSAVITWLLPSGYLLGFHFRILGRPLDYQLYSSFSALGAVCAVGAREFARWGNVDKTYYFCLGAGAGAIGINVLRFVNEATEMRSGSVLNRELSASQFHKARVLWATTGLLCSGHQLFLGHTVAGVLTVVLNGAGAGLLYVAQMRVAPLQSTDDALLLLGSIAGGAYLTTFSLWIRDGIKLLRGRVLTAGESLKVQGDDDDAGFNDAQLKPPAHWRLFKTPAGHDYFYDPATERIHYLSAHGKNNYVIDPTRNVSVTYDTLEELERKLAGDEGDEAEAGSPAAAEAAAEQAAEAPAPAAVRAKKRRRKKKVSIESDAGASEEAGEGDAHDEEAGVDQKV